MKVDIFIPCFVDQLFPETAFNMVKVLEKVGCEVNYNPGQTCCGQPAFNAGHWDIAKEIGEKFINEFKEDRYIVAPSASCVGMVKNYYPDLFNNTSLHNDYTRVRKNVIELSDFLVNVLKISDVGATLNGLATYHDSCAGLRECGIKQEPRKLLEKVRGLELKEMEGTDTCCGFGGLFAVKFEAISVSLAEQKVESAVKTGAKYLISTDLSCLMHMDGYIKKNNLPLEVKHLADVLAGGWE